MLSGLWIALAIVFIGGERAVRVALRLLGKLRHPFGGRPPVPHHLEHA